MDAVTSADLQGRITSWNASAERIYGYTQGELPTVEGDPTLLGLRLPLPR